MTKDEIISYLDVFYKKYGYEFVDDKNIVTFKENHKKEWVIEHLKVDGNSLKKINKLNAGRTINTKMFQNFKLIDNYIIINSKNNFENTKYIYDVLKGKIIVLEGIWNNIIDDDFKNEINYYRDYNCFLGSFFVCCNRVLGYKSLLTKKREEIDFYQVDGPYHGIIDLEGKLKDNKIFKGKSVDKIEEIYNMDEYDSLNSFKKLKYNLLVNEVEEKLNKYLSNIYDSKSPYKEYEFIKTLGKKD